MKDEISAALAPLVGMRFTRPDHGLDLHLWEFKESSKPGFALHVACPWRVIANDRILVGYGDYYRSATTESLDENNRKAGTGKRWIDVQLDVLRNMLGPEGVLVESVEASVFGGFALDLAGGMRVEVFPDTSYAPHDEYDEYWRLFELGEDSPHFVVSASDIRGRE